MSYRIEEIEGIGPVYGERLRAVGIRSSGDLLTRCAGAAGRRHVAAQTGIKEKRLLEWTNLADLMRVPGIGRQYAELLEAAGVDSIKELRHRSAENLARAMAAANSERRLTKVAPRTGTIIRWIDAALGTDPMITY